MRVSIAIATAFSGVVPFAIKNKLIILSRTPMPPGNIIAIKPKDTLKGKAKAKYIEVNPNTDFNKK